MCRAGWTWVEAGKLQHPCNILTYIKNDIIKKHDWFRVIKCHDNILIITKCLFRQSTLMTFLFINISYRSINIMSIMSKVWHTIDSVHVMLIEVRFKLHCIQYWLLVLQDFRFLYSRNKVFGIGILKWWRLESQKGTSDFNTKKIRQQ